MGVLKGPATATVSCGFPPGKIQTNSLSFASRSHQQMGKVQQCPFGFPLKAPNKRGTNSKKSSRPISRTRQVRKLRGLRLAVRLAAQRCLEAQHVGLVALQQRRNGRTRKELKNNIVV